MEIFLREFVWINFNRFVDIQSNWPTRPSNINGLNTFFWTPTSIVSWIPWVWKLTLIFRHIDQTKSMLMNYIVPCELHIFLFIEHEHDYMPLMLCYGIIVLTCVFFCIHRQYNFYQWVRPNFNLLNKTSGLLEFPRPSPQPNLTLPTLAMSGQ